MPVPGYDPEDVDDALETNLSDEQLEEYLSESERESYRAGDADLIDLLSEDEIHDLMGGEEPAET